MTASSIPLRFCIRAAALWLLGAGTCAVAQCVPGTLHFELHSSPPGFQHFFGGAVAASSDRYVVGAVGDGPGKVYVFDAATGTMTASMTNPNMNTTDQYGSAVAISGDYVVVGAYLDDTLALNSGIAYVYDVSAGSNPPILATLNNPAASAGDEFGRSVSISGDWAVIGAPDEDDSGINAGQAYVFDVTTGPTPAMMTLLASPAAAAEDQFGYSVGISGNYAVVGAYLADDGVADCGIAFVYDMSGGGTPGVTSTLHNPYPTTDDWFGRSVAINAGTVIIGAPGEDINGTDAGAAYHYNFISGGATPPLLSRFFNPSPGINDGLGASVSIAPNLRLILGAPGVAVGASNVGRAFIFDAVAGTPPPLATLDNPDPTLFDFFGTSVSISSVHSLVGSSFDDPGGVTSAGTAYAYSCAVVVPTATPTPSGPTLRVLDGPFLIPNGGGPVDFGSALPGGMALSRTLTVRNLGDQTMFTANLMVPTPYVVTDPLDFSIPAFSQDSLTIELPTGSPGLFAGNVQFDNNDPGENPFVFSITGLVGNPTPTPSATQTATPTPSATPTPTDPEAEVRDGPVVIPDGGGPVDFGSATVGGPAPFKIFTVHNLGATQSLFCGAPSVPGSYFVTEPLAFLIPPGGSDTFRVELSTAAPGVFGGTISFSTSDPDEGVYNFTITGEIVTSAPTPTPSVSPSSPPSPTPSPGSSPTATSSPAIPTATATGFPVTSSPSPTPVCCPGDADNSGGSVNAQDFLAVQAAFGANNGTGGFGDADCSGGAVNAQDFLAVQANFGANCGP